MIKVRVLYFALARDLVGQAAEELSLTEGTTVAALRRQLSEAHPAAAAIIARSMLAVAEEYAPDDLPLLADAEVAVIPPVSGGEL